MITAGGAGDKGFVLESASPMLPLLWAEDLAGKKEKELWHGVVERRKATEPTW